MYRIVFNGMTVKEHADRKIAEMVFNLYAGYKKEVLQSLYMFDLAKSEVVQFINPKFKV